MRIKCVFTFLSLLTIIITAWMLPPFLYAFFAGGENSVIFGQSIAAGVAVAWLLRRLGRGVPMSRIRSQEAFASVTLSWIFASAIGALPYYLDGVAPTYADCFFEAMSGFTTTGATVIVNLEHSHRSILLWRALTHWLGGMGIIVLTLTVAPLLGIGGFQLYKAEAPGLIHEKITPRATQTAKLLWIIYVSLTLILTLLLMIGGMSFYDAVTNAMGTISTGGFSVRDSSIAFYASPFSEWVITLFMFLSGASFIMTFKALRALDGSHFLRDPEFRFYTAFVTAAILLISVNLYLSGSCDTIEASLRVGAFQAVSFITTTGFVSCDYEVWPFFSQAVLFFCLFPGACSSSTSGGIKQIRLLVLFKHVARQIRRRANPRAVLPLHLGDQTLDAKALSSCLAFFSLYIIIFVLGVIVVSGFEPDLLTTTSSVASMLSNVGPALGKIGTASNFASQPQAAKWIYSFLMLCGRLELYTVIILFSREYWRDGITWNGGTS